MRARRVAAVGAASALAAGLVAGAAAGGAAAGGASAESRAGRHHASAFASPRQNPWFPLRPGTVTRYRGSSDGEHFREIVTVTHRHKRIQGVRTVVVRDVVRRLDGSLAEATSDWYAPDRHGNVWYFGEDTATYDQAGRVESREGSWRAGVRGAVRGIVMPARPRPTKAYRQEFWAGHAEDQAWVVQRGVTARVPYGSVRHGIRSFEWTRLEPGVMSQKIYGRGLGIVAERDLSGGNERFELVSVSHR